MSNERKIFIGLIAVFLATTASYWFGDPGITGMYGMNVVLNSFLILIGMALMIYGVVRKEGALFVLAGSLVAMAGEIVFFFTWGRPAVIYSFSERLNEETHPMFFVSLGVLAVTAALAVVSVRRRRILNAEEEKK